MNKKISRFFANLEMVEILLTFMGGITFSVDSLLSGESMLL